MPDDTASREPGDAVARNDSELMSLLGCDDEDGLAWVLFAEIDGGVHLLDGEGIQLFIGVTDEVLVYPIRIAELRDLAQRMEAAEDARLTREARDNAEEPAPGDLTIWLGDDAVPRARTVPPPAPTD
jgi:hypothetical protein